VEYNTSDLDCIALVDSSTCGLCKSGFELDSSGICRQESQDNCETLRTSDSEELISIKSRWYQRNGKNVF
jgi:hypothetical protein